MDTMIPLYVSLTREFEALKDRVRFFIDQAHPQSDGEWKESILRNMLRRYLPQPFRVARGFIRNKANVSKQVDLFVYDATYPPFFQDGDFVIISADAVRAIIEVKTRLRRQDLPSVIAKLADNCEGMSLTPQGHTFFSGIFAYEGNLETATRLIRKLPSETRASFKRIINHAVIGCSAFIKFWEASPDGKRDYRSWRLYAVEDLAAGYFIFNLIHHLAPDTVTRNTDLWFPEAGKEIRFVEDAPFLINK